MAVNDELRRLEELPQRECMALLGSVPLGRIVFSARALPAIRPVCHLVDGDNIIVRADSGVPIISAVRSAVGSVVAYEADEIEPADQRGWTVTVIGVAFHVTDLDEAARYRHVLRPWAGGGADQLIAIRADMVRGFRLVPCTAGHWAGA
jgi:hypothetical protein